MGLDFALRNRYKVGTNEYYGRESLQQRWHTVSGNEQSSKSFLACFGGYNPFLRELDQFTSDLRGE